MVTLEAMISRSRMRRPSSRDSRQRRVARMQRVTILGFLVAGAVASSPVALAAVSASPSSIPSPTPSPTSPTPSPTPSPTSPTPSPTPSPTSPTPSPTPSPTSPTPRPTPSPTSPTARPTPSPTRPTHKPGGKPSPKPSRVPQPSPSSRPVQAPVPMHVPTSPAAHSAAPAPPKKGHLATATVSSPVATQTRTRAAGPPANVVAGAGRAGGAAPAGIAALTAMFAGFALLAGRWLRLSLRRRAHPPRHAHRTTEHRALPSRGHRRLPSADDYWRM